MNNHIIVNATAARIGGALSILKQFIENIPESQYSWLIFVSPGLKIKSNKDNIIIQEIQNVTAFHKRLYWDAIGLNKWIKLHNINPVAKISLQNTGFKIGENNIPEFIYYHQSLPFYKKHWNPLKKQERSLFFYKNIYPFFVKLFLNKKTKILVQLDFIKKGFIKKFNSPQENICVFSPSVLRPILSKKIDLPLNQINLFYPASNLFYKNHQILLNVLEDLDKNEQLFNLYLTINRSKNNNLKNIKFLGAIPFSEVSNYYHSVDALVFPSYIETFGLPLLEAASIGIPIIAADLPYAREVLKEYEGVTYVNFNDLDGWKKAITNLKKGKRYKPLDIEKRPGWKELFNFIESEIEYQQ